VQEEACILGVPRVTMRDRTERPETVDVGANVLVHRNAEAMVAALNRPIKPWTNPFGDGHTAERILDVIMGQHVKPVNAGYRLCRPWLYGTSDVPVICECGPKGHWR